MSILGKVAKLLTGGAGEAVVSAGTTMLDEAFYTSQERAKDGQLKDEKDMSNELDRLRLVYEHERTLNKETNSFIRLLQKLPRIIGANGVVIWFVWNLWLLTLPTWAAEHGAVAYIPSGTMAALLGGIWAFIWATRSIEKKNGTHNQ